MTKRERKTQWANFEARHPNWKSSIRLHQSGFREQFGDIEQPTIDSFVPKDTTDVLSGFVAREGADQAWATDVPNALAHIKRAIGNIGENRSVDDGTLDGLNKLASTMQALVALPGNLPVPKAKVNQGATAPAMHYPANKIRSTPGAGKTVLASELSKIVADAEKLTTHSSRIAQIYKL
jgi:hypothetical protein